MKEKFPLPFPSPLPERDVERSETGRGKRMKEKVSSPPFPSPQAERDIERSETGRGKDLARSTFQNRIADCTIKTPLL